MFNKKKLDSRVRFQNQNFQKQLDRQRNYKRGKKTFPQTDWGVFLSKIGLGSIKARIFVGLVLAFLIYIVYVPNFLFIKNIEINGVTQPGRENIKKVVESYLNKKLPWPQKNLILLSKKRLENYLLQNNQSILKVDKITKVYFGNLIINIVPRQDAFILSAKNGLFKASGDGLITEVIPDPSVSSTTLPSGLVLIKLKDEQSLFVGEQAFTAANANALRAMFTQAASTMRSEVEYFGIDTLSGTDITAFTKNRFRVLFDLKTDPGELERKLKLLFSQFSDQELYNLEYVDMRFEDRGYVCHKNQPCVKDIKLPEQNSNATGTPESANNN